MKNSFSSVSNLQTQYHFKLYFQILDQHTGDKWLIRGTKHRKENQLQNLEPPVEYPSKESKHDIKESKGNMFNPTFKENVRDRNIQDGAYLQNHNNLVTESPNM